MVHLDFSDGSKLKVLKVLHLSTDALIY